MTTTERRALLQRKKMSLRYVAGKVGSTEGMVRRAINGERIERLEKHIANLCNVSVVEMFGPRAPVPQPNVISRWDLLKEANEQSA